MSPISFSVIATATSAAGRAAGNLQQSVRRARLEGERRVLQRQHRAALEALGDRVVDLVREGTLTGALISPEVANVETKLMEIDAKSAELEGLSTLEGRSHTDHETAPESGMKPSRSHRLRRPKGGS